MAYRQSAAQKREQESLRTVERPEITALPENRDSHRGAKKAPYFQYSLMAIAVFVMTLCVLAGYSRLAELTLEVDKKRGEMEELLSEANALDAKREQRFNLVYVEDAAVNRLGMVKQDKNQITYLSITNEEKIVSADEEVKAIEEHGSGSGILDGFSRVIKFVWNFIN